MNCIVIIGFPFFFYIFLKGRCNREKPPCKYFHPPQHLKDQLLINGRNNLAFKNALLQQVGITTTTGPPVVRSQVPAVVRSFLFERLYVFRFAFSPKNPVLDVFLFIAVCTLISMWK